MIKRITGVCVVALLALGSELHRRGQPRFARRPSSSLERKETPTKRTRIVCKLVPVAGRFTDDRFMNGPVA